MKQYKFIGTEQDLIDNGFKQNKASFTRSNDDDDKSQRLVIFIPQDFEDVIIMGLLGVESQIISYDSKLKPKEEVKFELIQDLIDKGLVEEVSLWHIHN